MGKILSLAWNDIRIAFSSRSTFIFFLVLPIIFTSVIGLSMEQTEDQRTPIVVVDEDQSVLSERFRQTLEQSTTVRPTVLERSEADAQFTDRKVRFILTIPSGFGSALEAGEGVALGLQGTVNDSNILKVSRGVSAAADQMSSALNAATISVESAEAYQPFADDAARVAYFDASLERAEELLAAPGAEASFSDGGKDRLVASGFEQSSPGQLVTWVLITLLGASEVFVNERLAGTLKRLVVTPTRKATILVGKLLGRLSMGLIQILLLIGFGAFVLGVDWGSNAGALALVVITFALAAVALGLMLGTFAKTRSQASGLTTLFSLGMAALGGAWWPLEITPKAYQQAVQVLPTTWAMRGFNDVIVRGQGVNGIMFEAGILAGFAALFFAIGVARFRFE